MFNLKRLKIFEIDQVASMTEGIFVWDTADNEYFISRMVEGNVPLDGVHEDGRIWLIFDKDENVVRWKFKCPIFDEWDF